MEMYLKIVFKAANSQKWIWKITVFLTQCLVFFFFSLNKSKKIALILFKS